MSEQLRKDLDVLQAQLLEAVRQHLVASQTLRQLQEQLDTLKHKIAE